VGPQVLCVQNPLDLTTAQAPARFLPQSLLQAVQGPDLAKRSFRACGTLAGQLDHLTPHR
jgi:hypothetical protein